MIASKFVYFWNYVRKQSQVATFGNAYYHVRQRREINTSKWIRALTEGDKLLGHPDILTIDKLMSQYNIKSQRTEKLDLSLQYIKTFKRLIYNNDNLQVRGLVSLLYAKAIGNLQRERRPDNVIKINHIATTSEILHCSQQIHKMINDKGIKTGIEKIDKNDLESMKNGAILIGDFLMAKAWTLLGSIGNTEVMHMINGSTRDFMEGEFVFSEDKNGESYPLKSANIKDWEKKTLLTISSLLANSLRCIAIISELNEGSQEHALEFGRKFGLAWKVSTDWKSFIQKQESAKGNSSFSLVSHPIILHLERNASILEFMTPFENDLGIIDYEKIQRIVINSSTVDDVKDICDEYVTGAIRHVQQLPNSDARTALKKIIQSLQI